MADTKWTPLDPRTGGRLPERAPVEGVPDWLLEPLWEWVLLYVFGGNTKHPGAQRYAAFTALSLEFQLNLGSSRDENSRFALLRRAVDREPDFLLSIADWALHMRYGGEAHLRTLLDGAGSVWALAPDQKRLTRRVLPEAQAAAERVISAGDKAAELIGSAWLAVYGLKPNPTDGFNQAVRAVEAVACPVIIPNDGDATLGRAIGILKANKGGFSTVFQNPRNTDPVDAVLALMQLVWTNNYARHAADPSVPLHVSQEEAEAALTAAVALVTFFQRGFFVRSP